MKFLKEKNSTKFKNVLIEWCHSTTSHGIPNIARSESKLIAIFWLVAFLSSTGFCGYMIVKTIIDIFQLPIYVNIQITEEIPAIFPSISFCNLNPFDTSDSKVNDIFQNLLVENNFTYDKSPTLLSVSASSIIKSYVYYLSDKDKKKFTFDFNQMVYSCKFNGFTCKDKDFELFYHFDYGNCYKFNPNGSKIVGKSGLENGLILEIDVGNATNKELYSIKRGIRFLVHNHSDSKSISNYGQDASVGFATEVKITRQMSEKLSQPYSNCLSDLTSSNPKKTNTMEVMFSYPTVKQYSKEMCMNICFQIKLEMECNCSEPAIPTHQNISKCSGTDDITCKEMLFQNFFSSPSSECNDECPVECVLYKYSTKIGFAEYFTKWYFDIFEKKSFDFKENRKIEDNFLKKINLYDSIEALRKDVLLIQFYYEDTSITKITEKQFWSLFSILSSIGGNLGLFVGMSILSLFEVLEIIFKLILFSFKNSNKKKIAVK